MSTGDPNPYFDPGPFGVVLIQDVLIACTLEEVDGATKPEDWNIQKGTKSKGATASLCTRPHQRISNCQFLIFHCKAQQCLMKPIALLDQKSKIRHSK